MKISLKIVHLKDPVCEETTVEQALGKRKLDTEIRVTGNREQYVAALADFSPDLILSEFSLPDIHCSEALEILRQRGMNIPFIVFSSTFSDEMADELLIMGADDYVTEDRVGRLAFAIVRNLEKYQLKIGQQDLQE
jgi:DNA-binding response OmpR family regulator